MVTTTTISGVDLELRSDWSVGIGGSTWTCGERLCEYVARHPDEFRCRRILELGSGTGLVGLFIAKVVPEASVMVTDLPDHVGLLEENVKRNGGAVTARALDWERDDEIPGAFDIVVATECAYHPRLHAPLVGALARACGPGVRCFVGITKSDTTLDFFDRVISAGLEYRLLEGDSYFGLLEIRRQVDFYREPRTEVVRLWTQCWENRGEAVVCTQCGEDLLRPEDWVEAAAATIEASTGSRDDVVACACGALFCSEACRKGADMHRLLCVGHRDADDPLVRFKTRLADDDVVEDADTLILAAAWLATGAPWPRHHENGGVVVVSAWVSELWKLLGELPGTAHRTATDFGELLSFVRSRAVHLERPHPLCRVCRDAYLHGEILPESLREGLVRKYKPDPDMTDDHALSWILAAPDEFFEPVRLVALCFLDVRRAASPTCAVAWAPAEGRFVVARLDDRCVGGGGGNETVGRIEEEEEEEEKDVELLLARARLEDRWDDIEELLAGQESPAALYELSRVAGWRGDWNLALERLRDAVERAPEDPTIAAAWKSATSFFPYVLREDDVKIPFVPSLERYLDGRIAVAKNALDAEACGRMVALVEARARAVGWSTSRHYSVPTTDVPVGDVPELLDWFNTQLATRLFPLLEATFQVPAASLRVIDAFFVKYSPDAQRDLPLHEDQAQYSLTIAMNPAVDYEGGGTYFPHLGRPEPLNVDVGGVIAFDGALLHGGYPTRRGTRYILAVFTHSCIEEEC